MESLADVRAYFSGDRIVCLICGKPFRGLGQHVRYVHDLSAREYKERYGLPVSRGLEVQAVRQHRADIVTATRAAGRLPQTEPPASWAKGVKPKYVRQDMRRMDRDQVLLVMGWLRAGDTITEACARPGMPRWTAVHDYLRREPQLQAAWDALIESLPFPQQARMKKLGARFEAAAAALGHLTCAAVAAELVVSEEVVRRYRVRMRK